VTDRRWLYRNTAAEEGLAGQLLPWGECFACGVPTQWRILQRDNGIPNGVEWFVCPEHLP